MNDSTFDTITRHASGAVSRRGSLRLLGGAALAGALAAPELASAGKAGQKTKKQAKRCKQQGGQCRSYIAKTCAAFEDPQECVETYTPCCEYFERCKAGAGLMCFTQSVGDL